MLSMIFMLIFASSLAIFSGECVLLGGLMFFICYMMSGEMNVLKLSFVGECDMVSWGLICLSLWIISVCLGVKGGMFLEKKGMFNFMLLIMCFFLLMSFYSRDYLMFYIMFEASLVPIILLILGWGYQPEKFNASLYMFLYTMFGSLPLLFYILYSSVSSGSCSMYFLSCQSSWLWVSMIMAFLIKFPVYSSHLWLLKAHTEAPTEGSMILAGVLLKLGGYGLLRVFFMSADMVGLIRDYLVFFSLLGSVLMAVGCLSETNMKLLIAKSSVVHMGPCVSGVLCYNSLSINGLMGLMVGHGLCSSGLFYISGVSYEKSGSRSVVFSKGCMNYAPVLGIFWFLMLILNSAAPPSLNLLSEIGLFISLNFMSSWNLLMMSLVSFFSAGYNIYLFSISQHGHMTHSMKGFGCLSVMNMFILFMHWCPANLLLFMMFI